MGLYYGLGSTLICQVPNLAISYSVYGLLRDTATAYMEDRAERALEASQIVVVDDDGKVVPETEAEGPLAATAGSSDSRNPEKKKKKHTSMDMLIHTSCGALSGIASTLAIYPLDVVRRRMQLQGLHRRDGRLGPLGEATNIIRMEGVCAKCVHVLDCG